MKIKRNPITTAPAVILKAPRRMILGKKSRGRLKDSDVFCDFLDAFCHVAMDRCTSENETIEWRKAKFGMEYEYRKCPDEGFIRHLEDSLQLARDYLDEHRLYAFEVAMVDPSEQQLIGFRILLSQLSFAREKNRVRNIYTRLSTILESVRTIKIRETTDEKMYSIVYRPRIRIMTRRRDTSNRQVDRSKPDDPHIAVPIADSLYFANNLLSFYAHM